MSIFVSLGESGPRLERMAARAKEIIDAHREYEPAVEAERQAAGYYEAEAERTAAADAEKALRRDVAEARPQTVGGLMAKLKAVAEALGRDNLDDDTALEPKEIPTYDVVGLSVMRDALDVLNAGTAI